MSQLGDCVSIILGIVCESNDVDVKQLKLDCILEIMEVYEDYHTIIEFIEKSVIPKLHPQSKFKEYFNDKIHYYKLLIG